MADTPDPQNQGGQHNRGPGVFVAGNVYGDVSNRQTPQANHGQDYEPQKPGEKQRKERVCPDGNQPEGENEFGPGGALLGWTWLTVTLFGMSGYCAVGAFIAVTSVGDRVGAVLVALGSAFGGVMALAFAFAALTEVCAAGTANAADSARKRGRQGQRAAARLNLRYAVSVARVADLSAFLAGLIAGLFGFLAIGKKAADRAHEAREYAESEIVKTRSALGDEFGEE